MTNKGEASKTGPVSLKRCILKKIFTVILLILSTFSYGECLLTVRVAEFKPQYYQDEQGRWQGIAVELTQALFKEANCDITFTKTPWNRAIHLLEYGGIDVVLNMSPTQERAKYTHFIGPMLDETQVMMVKKNSQYKITRLEDIKQLPKRIGIQRGVFYGAAMMHKLANDGQFQDKFEYGSNESNLKKLQKGRILGVISNQYTAAYNIKQLNSPGAFKLHPFVFNRGEVYFGFSKKGVSSALRQRFEQALIRLQDKGALLRITATLR